tara:strand:- start:8429 stop:8833 length:405 start_codon:yes stop_codon:yes gene_type:complete
MGPIQLLKDVVRKVKTEMRQTESGIYHPLFPERTTGELADRLCELSVEIQSQKNTEVKTFSEVDSIAFVLENSRFDYSCSEFGMLWSVHKDIRKIKNTNRESNLEYFQKRKLLEVKNTTRESLIATIDILKDPK